MLTAPTTSEVLVCAICGNRHSNQIFVAREMMFGMRERFRYLECAKCRCLHLVDVPGDLSKYYPENYYSFGCGRGLEAVIEDRWAAYALGKFTLTGWFVGLLLGPHATMKSIRRARIALDDRVLDVGCGAGSLIRFMKRMGYRNVSGIDPYIKSDIDGGDGLVVLKRPLKDMTGEFDVIMFHHSFEHIADQTGTLLEIRRLLRPGGRILIRVPMADSFAWKHYGVNWVHLDAPRHLFLHSPTSLRLLAEQCGLRVVELTYEGNSSQFVGSEGYAKDISLVDQRKGGILHRLQELLLARRYRTCAEELNLNSQGDWGCFVLQT